MDLIPANYAPPGYLGVPQPIVIRDWTVGTIVHELGHVLGYWHEQQRLDRNDFIRIEWQNIPDEAEFSFIVVPLTADYGPYDFGSIMHYDQCSFSDCENCEGDLDDCRTMTVLPPRL